MKPLIQPLDPSYSTLPKTPSPFFDDYEYVNRLIIIGNGFDLAHGLKSSFTAFILNYFTKSIRHLHLNQKYQDTLINIEKNLGFSNSDMLRDIADIDAYNIVMALSNHGKFKVTWNSPFFKSIVKEIHEKNWVDVEIHYFDFLKTKRIINNPKEVAKLNSDFEFIKNCFIKYLEEELNKHQFTLSKDIAKQFNESIKVKDTIPKTINKDRKPNQVCILNFNYTNIVELYRSHLNSAEHHYIPIHGELSAIEKSGQEPIFGFGDEMDEDYTKFELMRNDDLFQHIKSFKYLQFKHYLNLIEFIGHSPFQVQIFGHSCGLSDRTLLNTIFEHENCISIKPFYYDKNGTNDYEKKSYAIARHFKSKARLRVTVVNKEYCEAMFQPFTPEQN
jgi:hypothetical protein